MVGIDGIAIHMALGGSYRGEVLADSPLGWWRLNVSMGGAAVARDVSGNGHHAVGYSNVDYSRLALLTDNSASFVFGLGAGGGYVDFGDVNEFEFVGAFSVEFWVQRDGNQANTQFLVACSDTSPTNLGWRVTLVGNDDPTNAGKLRFRLFSNIGGDIFNFVSAGTIIDNLPHHVVCTWTGAGGASTAKIYVDGVVTNGTTTLTTIGTANRFMIGSADDSPTANYLNDTALADVAVYSGALSASRVVAHYAAGVWTAITADLMRGPGLRLAYGIKGGGPLDRIPDSGLADFFLRNDEGASGGLSHYSPNHANAREGFTFGALVRILFTQAGVLRQRFCGRVSGIDPESGTHSARRCRVVVSDLVSDLINTDLRSVGVQVGVSEDDAILALLEALPVEAQPLAFELDAGVDTLTYAFADLGPGAKAAQPLADLVTSTMGFWSVDHCGRFEYENRMRRQTSSPLWTVNNELTDLLVPTTLQGVHNRFRMISRQHAIDAAATRVLFSIPVASATNPSTIAVGVLETIERWGTYFDPDNVIRDLAGTDGVQPIPTTDYLANSAADGTGTDETADVDVEAVFFATTVLLRITNNNAAPVYITWLRVLGKGLYEEAPITVEVSSQQPYGDRPITIDLRYQGDLNKAVDLGTYLLAQHENPASQAGHVSLFPHTSTGIMNFVLQGRIGDRFSLSETVTGFANDVFAHGYAIEAKEGQILSAGVNFSTAVFADGFWILEDPDSELDLNTNLGFG